MSVASIMNNSSELQNLNELLVSASAGDSHAQFLLGFNYSIGKFDDKKDLYSAIHWFKEAIKQNNHNAMYALAALYLTEPPPFRKPSSAISLMAGSAELGNAKALYFMACQYLKGEYVVLNNDVAITYLELAAIKNHIQSIFKLAQIFESGEIVEMDKAKALAFYKFAKELGHKNANEHKSKLILSMTKKDIDEFKKYSRIEKLLNKHFDDVA